MNVSLNALIFLTLLDAREAISVSERTLYIARVRNLAKALCWAYLTQREKLGFPLLKTKLKYKKIIEN